MQIPVDYVEGAFQLSIPTEPPRRADAVRNRRLALDAAMQLLAEPGVSLTVETIAKKAGLGAATVVRAFGGKDALLDAAVSGLLQPVVQRAHDLLGETTPTEALRIFLRELIAFQTSHHAINDQLGGLDLPATTALRVDLVSVVEKMVDGARRDGTVRTDITTGIITTLIGQTALAVARSQPPSQALVDAYLTVVLDGLHPTPASLTSTVQDRPTAP
ncbi:TetR/AcrR family transcriptional regulator [Kribbella qitaiheensis]|uniref:TetR/AcrR family transcriptional regulator n=1 Tax=Kribbella qitaiheensis TaxID=1544730 RepID=A0A7G6X797_9ACTN|nr:TetR/AcrR family transcriptional regulator [Kribbella qitaiheensis]QNE22112.1 TetR/AcrR family transcriptional regulator [Kribbella qitaiheensis]